VLIWISPETQATPGTISSYEVPVDTDVMLVWGELTANLEKQGRKMPAIDSLIAAIDLHGKLSLVTRNEGDFRHVDVPITNPWTR
jgi:tRNA(fMet)-specific endonuclease VapC